MENFHIRLKKAIKQSGLSQKKISKLLNIPEITIGRITRGEVEPGIFKVAAIAQLLNVSLDWLITGIEPQKKEESIKFHLHHLKGGTYKNIVNTGVLVNEPTKEFNVNLPTDITDNEIAVLLYKYSKLSRKNRQMIQKILDLYLKEKEDE